MRAIVDKDTCIGCGVCPAVCPEIFEMQDDGKAGTITEEVAAEFSDQTKEAEESCPVNAITVE